VPRSLILGILLVASCVVRCNACQSPRSASNLHVSAAQMLTQRYAASRFKAWHIRATAVGGDCSVLQLQTEIILEDSMIEAMHYGAGRYDTYRGGMQQFLREHAFRGIAYRDVSGRVWIYGNVSPTEPEGLEPCH
jgi:hypothetical protein